MSDIFIRPATHLDLPRIRSLLESENLPVLGVAEHISTFLVAERNGVLVGSIGIEVYGETGLLRSAVVHNQEQGRGIGGKLYASLLNNARRMGIRRLLLLTNTAEAYFSRRGFIRIPQSSVSGPVTSSVEFSGACPSHAVCMELLL